MRLEYIVHKEPTGGYSAEFPSLPGCCTDGDTLEELRANAREAAEGYLESMAMLPPGADPDATNDWPDARREYVNVRIGGPWSARRKPTREIAFA